ncbi:putative lysosomal Pro-Xaa carboxypeptidase [Helianthus annuus]|nr:putative lysosomal Pro-Xaa carboxypeptidase [Helianthus annuus]KAJ0849298.1 putative lysosomal Pro-Xaa carboxypeptidase [Helianthus annuus]KAJ0858298.1 putative lysosomal Pro-Xaa carboxypeptidase [Helianthus annuus]
MKYVDNNYKTKCSYFKSNLFVLCLVLASWFRLKYPHIAYGALAASAPILYFKGLTPENAYDRVVSNDFNVSKSNI